MNFKVVPTVDVTSYLMKSEGVSKNADRNKSVAKRLKEIEEKQAQVLFAFVNEYGESYLAININHKVFWCGDESDWEYATSYFEDRFVADTLSKIINK